MLFIPNRYQLILEVTLPICIRRERVAFAPEMVHVADLDATLTLAYWDEGDGEYGWEVDEATIDGVTINVETDPYFWAVIERAVIKNDAIINERVQELAQAAEAA